MYAKTLAEHVQAYLDLQTFLDECRADGKNTERALGAIEQARRELHDALAATRDPVTGPVADAVRAYLEAEHGFDKSMAAGADLDVPARQMERARRDLERQLHAVSGEDIQEVQARRVPSRTPAAPVRQRRILVACDESAPARHALEVAVKMAEEAGGRLLLVHAVRPASPAAGEFVSSIEWLDSLHHREADEMLAKVRLSLPRSLESEQMVREGLPADEILTAAKVWNADLIVIGTRARGRIAQFLLGSTADAVIRRAACPVMVIGRKAAWAAEELSSDHPGVALTTAN
jgi:nucleotide-binding universal stress UspA family protein